MTLQGKVWHCRAYVCLIWHTVSLPFVQYWSPGNNSPKGLERRFKHCKILLITLLWCLLRDVSINKPKYLCGAPKSLSGHYRTTRANDSLNQHPTARPPIFLATPDNLDSLCVLKHQQLSNHQYLSKLNNNKRRYKKQPLLRPWQVENYHLKGKEHLYRIPNEV